MGKIFKALKKAEKQNSIKPALSPELKSAQTDISMAGIQATADPAQSNERPITPPDRTSQDRVSSVASDKNNTVIESDHLPPIETVPVDSKTFENPSSEPGSIPLHITSPIQGKVSIEASAIETQRSTESVIELEPGQKAGGFNIAVVEQAAPKPEPATQSLSSQASVETKKESATGIQQTASRAEVKVRYSRTKVQINDPQKLKENKVLSVFEDFETTNQFKILRTQVLKKLKSIRGNSILVTSANPYEGKTFTSINLGVSIAKEFNRTVLIIDADIRRPSRQHTDFSTKFFSLKVEKGLTDYLTGDADIEEVLINPGIDKLTLIPGGKPVDNSPELLNSARMEQMMLDIKSRYPDDRLVIVDGPAILHFPDAMILCRYVDGVLPVVESEKTSADNIKKMIDYIKEFNVLGLVLNKNKE